nr:hypothetical protein [Corynebacterium auriscanis]
MLTPEADSLALECVPRLTETSSTVIAWGNLRDALDQNGITPRALILAAWTADNHEK